MLQQGQVFELQSQRADGDPLARPHHRTVIAVGPSGDCETHASRSFAIYSPVTQQTSGLLETSVDFHGLTGKSSKPCGVNGSGLQVGTRFVERRGRDLNPRSAEDG
jgi:hypothetical protein